MKKVRFVKAAAMTLCVVLALGSMAYADEDVMLISAESSATAAIIIDSDLQAKAGETVTINLTLTGGSDVKNYVVKDFEYDKEALELVSAEVVKIGEPTIAHWMDGVMAVTYSSKQSECEGKVLEVTFKVNDSAKSGTYSVSCVAQINQEDIAVTAGSIVVEGVAGDAEVGDDVVTGGNVTTGGSVTTDNDDVAPEDAEIMTSKKRGEDIICLKIGKSLAYAYGKMVAIDSDNESVVSYIQNDRTMVPLRFVSENLGAEVLWENGWNYCYVKKDDKQIKITFNSADIEVGDEIITYDAPVQVVEDRTMVPLRFISEELGYNVHWNEPNQLVVISPTDNPWKKDREAELSLLSEILVTYLLNGDL